MFITPEFRCFGNRSDLRLFTLVNDGMLEGLRKA
jgi:hypothetical protein